MNPKPARAHHRLAAAATTALAAAACAAPPGAPAAAGAAPVPPRSASAPSAAPAASSTAASASAAASAPAAGAASGARGGAGATPRPGERALGAAASNPLSVLVELEPGVDEKRWPEALVPLGGQVRGRLRHVRDALVVEVPAASLEALRRLPGVRRVTMVPDAQTWPPPPSR